MSDRSWQFRTAQGTVTVGSDAITIRSTPREFLAGQVARWRDGTDWQQTKSVLAVVWILGLFVLIGSEVATLLDGGLAAAAIVSGLSIAFAVVQLWTRLLREITIPRSAIESVSIDEEDRRLRIVHESTGRLDTLSQRLWTPSTPLSEGRWKQSLEVPTDEELQEAREVFRLRGVELDRSEEAETETSYRFVTENGVYFCEDCGSQVSPADSDCPACGYALRVERPKERSESIEYATD